MWYALFQDTILDAIRKTKVNFVRCILPVDTAGHFSADALLPGNKSSQEAARMDVPLVRQQLRAAEMLDAVRIHRQGQRQVHTSTAVALVFEGMRTPYASGR